VALWGGGGGRGGGGGGSADGVSLSMGASLGEPAVGAPCWGPQRL
jgi:hypothetical protein